MRLVANIGFMGTLGGSLVAGDQHDRVAVRQVPIDIAKQSAAARVEKLNVFKYTTPYLQAKSLAA